MNRWRWLWMNSSKWTMGKQIVLPMCCFPLLQLQMVHKTNDVQATCPLHCYMTRSKWRKRRACSSVALWCVQVSRSARGRRCSVCTTVAPSAVKAKKQSGGALHNMKISHTPHVVRWKKHRVNSWDAIKGLVAPGPRLRSESGLGAFMFHVPVSRTSQSTEKSSSAWIVNLEGIKIISK